MLETVIEDVSEDQLKLSQSEEQFDEEFEKDSKIKILSHKAEKIVDKEVKRRLNPSSSLQHKTIRICDENDLTQKIERTSTYRKLKIKALSLKQNVSIQSDTEKDEEEIAMKKTKKTNSKSSKGDESTKMVMFRRRGTSPGPSVAGEGSANLHRVIQEIRSGPVLRRERPYPKVQEKRVKCLTCERGFSPLRIQAHQRICQKVFGKKRPVFDSRAKRLAHFGIYLYTSSLPDLPHKHATRWRQQHESLIAALRHGRAAQRMLARGVRLSELPPPPYDDHPELVSCRHCGRRFSATVAERHVPRCAEIRSNKSPYLWERPPWR